MQATVTVNLGFQPKVLSMRMLLNNGQYECIQTYNAYFDSNNWFQYCVGIASWDGKAAIGTGNIVSAVLTITSTGFTFKGPLYYTFNTTYTASE